MEHDPRGPEAGNPRRRPQGSPRGQGKQALRGESPPISTSKIFRYQGALGTDGGAVLEFWADIISSVAPPSFRAMGATALDDVWLVGGYNTLVHFGD